MMKTKQKRVLGVAIGLAMLAATFFFSRNVNDWTSNMPALSTANSLLDAQNMASVDEAINRDIAKTKDQPAGEADGSSDPPAAAAEDLADAADFDPAKEFLQIRALAPVTIFSKLYCPYSAKLKKLLLENYLITPQPTIVELDKHKHGKQLQEYLAQVTNRRTVPNVIVGTSSAVSRGGADDFQKLHDEGLLAKLMNTWGGKDVSVSRKEVPSNS